MPVVLERTASGDFDGRCLDIGLINNMPDAALESTEAAVHRNTRRCRVRRRGPFETIFVAGCAALRRRPALSERVLF